MSNAKRDESVHDSGLCDFSDTVSYAVSLSKNLPQEAVRYPRIDVLPWAYAMAWA